MLVANFVFLFISFHLFFVSFFFFNSYLFLVDWSLLYNIGFIGHTSTWINHRGTCGPPLLNLPPTSRPFPLLQAYQRAPVCIPWVRQQIPTGCLVTKVGVHSSVLLSPFISPSPSCSPPLSVSLFSMSTSPLLLREQIRQDHPSRVQVFLFLTDFPVSYALASSTSLEVPQMWSFSWPHSIQAVIVPYGVLRRVVELFGSIWVWASILSAPAELLLGEPSGLCERGAARSSPAARSGHQIPLPRAQDALPSDWARLPAGGSFLSSGPSGLGFLDNWAVSRLRGVGLPQCPSREALQEGKMKIKQTFPVSS